MCLDKELEGLSSVARVPEVALQIWFGGGNVKASVYKRSHYPLNLISPLPTPHQNLYAPTRARRPSNWQQ